MKPLIIAHRGDSINFPENTIEAFESALKKGADGIELDVHLDQNGNVIVVHDYSFDINKKYPFLKDVLEQFGQKGRLEIEIKSLNLKCIKEVKKLVGKYKPKDYEITTSILPLLPYIKKEFPNTKIGLIHASKLIESWMPKKFIEELLIAYLKLTGANVLHLQLEHYTPEIVNLLHKNKFLAHTHLKKENILENYKNAVKLGIDQCTFDDINLIKLI
ncbi:MAG: hypothetical protein COU25_00945 [Candidatus Levybacteria bacterium CG10_big_fil_rev_8_21_14_0_10_35_13]|nr:MAG: hypothetical protein COU25_00945 [Candidatus Levybacteria bacterium CG10_big_fil_rev_8_21_14_0_10_35_13]